MDRVGFELRQTVLAAAVASLAVWTGCGTTRWSDTARTATEQLLISNAVDRAVSEFDFATLAGKQVFFDASYLSGVTDQNYIVSTLRQHLLDSGCILRDIKDQAEFVVEARSGGVGTDRSDVLFGVPAVSVPSVPGVPLPSAIPELPFAKSTKQKAVAKIAVFAYNRITGRPVMQTGVDPAISMAKNSWFFGAGPFQHGTVYEGTKLAGAQFGIPIIGSRQNNGNAMASVPLTAPAIFPQNLEVPAAQLAAQTSTGKAPPPAAPPAAVPPPQPGVSSVSAGLPPAAANASSLGGQPADASLDFSGLNRMLQAKKPAATAKK